jgi:protocatechuate 3,4-dioxygenase beta subunit
VLANDHVTISPAAEYQTDEAGRLSIRYAPPADSRGLLTYLRHKNPDLIGAAWLPQAGGAVEVKLEPAVSLQGCVLDPNGKPSGGVQVAALPMSSQFVLTNAAGAFDIAWAREWEPGDHLCLMARRVESNWAALVDIDRQTKTIEIRLEPALTLAGAIEDENARPIPDARVSLSLGKSWRCFTPVRPVTTDTAGRYTFRTLPQKQEYVIFARATDYWEDGISTGLIYNQQTLANPGRIVLRKPVMSVSGVVVDGTGKPVGNIKVGTKGDHQPARATQTDADGRFTLQGVCRGDVEIWAKIDRVLYGTAATQAGRQDVRLVVQPIR